MPYDVFGMCNALYDILAEVSEEQLDKLGLSKGGMFLIDDAQQANVLKEIRDNIVNTEAGGSGANTMIGISLLGGTACFTSRVGCDDYGVEYSRSLEDQGVKANLGKGEGRTGTSVILITPDAQRTMCTYLGVSRDLQPVDVNTDDLLASKYLYITGYLWDMDNQKEAVLSAMNAARKAGIKVALSLSDPFCVTRHKDDFLRIIQDHVDVVLGNEMEATTITDTPNADEAAVVLGEKCEIVAVTMDERGSLIRQEDCVYLIPPYPVKAIDTTGAGDMYAAGLLYGLTRNIDLYKTGKIASYAAAQVVSKMGPRLTSIDLETVGKL